MVVEISFLRKCAVVVLLIPSVLALRCLSATMARTDSIALNESISDGQNLVSGNNKFVLGFFSPGTSSQRYIGIWYNSVPNGTVVWVGNRNNPVQDKSGILKFDNGSNLILVDGKGSLFTVASGVDVEDMEAAILDSGNFVLRSMMNPSNIVWESFAFPTDTWLPEMNITVGNFLTSWKSYDDPAMGEYTFGPGIANALQLYIWWNGHKFWTSAPWTGDTNSLIPDLTSISIIPVSFQCDKFTCKYTPNPKDRMTKIVLDRTGALDIKQFDPDAKSWTLLSRQPVSCDVSNLCGAYGVCNISMLSVSGQESVPPSLCHCPQGFVPQEQSNARKGCSRQTPLQCNGDGFIDMPHMQLPDCRQKLSVVENGDCQSACMNDCYCTAYINSPLDGCSLCHGNLTNLQSGNDGNGVGTLHLRLAASELKSSSRSGHRMILLAYILPSVAFLIFCLASFIWIRRWKNKGKGKQHDHSLVMASDVIKLWETEDRDSHFTTLSFSQIKIATDNFSTENKLGEGGFGPVYKGNLPNGQDVAVKRLAANSGQGLPEFKNEILLIAKLQHRNLVGLLGCCIDEEEMVLIYEYMPNKSLDFFLFEQSRRAFLVWSMRLNIIEGIAQGLIYLHKHSRLRIIHRDLKPSNVLLDSDMNPKISDFGMARIFDPKGALASTKRVVGTYGYMAPEYAMAGIFSIKSDVFSYGVLLLEIVSGLRNAGSHGYGNSLNLLGHAWELWKEGRWYDLIDKSLRGACPENMVLRCIHVGLLCVQEAAADRPSMAEVISMITNENATLPDPKQPGFLSMLLPIEADVPEGTYSLNDLSITVLDGKAKKTTTAGDDGRSTEGIHEKVDGMVPVKGRGGDPANEVVVSVPVHCEGCARKMRRSLLRNEGFEEVIVNNSTNTVVVTGQQALEDPMMVVEMVERRTRKKALLLSPSPAKLPPSSAVKNTDTKKEATKADMTNDISELDMKMGVVMKIEMHCEACSEEMKRRILNIKGVEEAVPHMKSSELMVKGAVEPATLVGFIHKCTGKKAAIIRAEPLDPPPAANTTAPMTDEKTPADANANQQEPSDNLKEKNEGVKEETKQEEKKGGGGGGEVQNVDEKTKTEKQDKGDGDGVEKEKTQVHMPSDAIDGVVEEKNQMKDHQFKLPVQDAVVAVAPEAGLYEYYYHPPYAYAYPHYAYQQYQYPYAGHPAAMYRPYPHYPPAPQTLSDENPEACTIM